MSTFKDLVSKAVELKGSQAKLAEEMGCSQQQVSYLLKYATSISAEMALAIDKATKGAVPRYALRPDIYGQPAKRSRARASA
ncbi:YdaS family helix-turn-helix protein [Brucella pituitosa]|uniref:Helix-turn-helix domain-containing protein n=1 Tax=Brucella pituitosa TaxID=571256 RepID=A0A643F6G1_9HYPH|nr:YdaS family helix-turn-helix protein [Brucella pituitosa]KAB0573401.1 helix-turn-helix domain-containing protein [Brucella pituitosa]